VHWVAVTKALRARRVNRWSLDADPPRPVLLTARAEQMWRRSAPRHLRLYRHQPELGLRALRQVLATDCNRSPRPELSYVMRWDGLVVSYTISDDAERTTTVSTAQLGRPASAHLAPPPTPPTPHGCCPLRNGWRWRRCRGLLRTRRGARRGGGSWSSCCWISLADRLTSQLTSQRAARIGAAITISAPPAGLGVMLFIC
jgi:hypothetical protein